MLTDSTALIGIVIIGLVAMVSTHVPPAITLVQVLAVELLAQALLLSALSQEKRILAPRKTAQHQIIVEIIVFGILAAVIAYINYRLFFVRNGLAPAYIDTTHPLYVQATSLTYLTLVLCQFMNLLFIRSDERKLFFTDYLWRNQKLVQAAAVSFFMLLVIIYNPWLQSFFGTGPLGLWDWIMAILCAATYTGLRVLQRHTRQHTRHEVVKLHHKVHTKR